VWFALGCYLGQNGNTNYRVLPIAVATLVALMCSGGESYYIYSLCGHANQDWKITAYLFDFFAVLLAFSQLVRSLYRENRLTRLIARLGILCRLSDAHIGQNRYLQDCSFSLQLLGGRLGYSAPLHMALR